VKKIINDPERFVDEARTYVGEFATCLEMAGASVSLCRLDDDRLALLKAPAHSPFFLEGPRP
jgi:dihydroxyacetone kinase-like protein